MRHQNAFKLFGSSLVLEATFLLALSSGPCWGQGREVRSIEYSDPRGATASVTNSNPFGSDQTSLHALEERLSKTFNFLKFTDSVSGAPVPRNLPRVVVVPEKSKNLGLLNNNEDWTLSDLIEGLPGTSDSEDRSKYGVSEGDERFARPSYEDPLDNLRGDDWLVQGVGEDAFWKKPRGSRSSPMLSNDEEGAQRRSAFSTTRIDAENSRWSRNQGRQGQVSDRNASSSLGRREVADFGSPEVYGLNRRARLDAFAQRQEAYRRLLGYAPRPSSAQPLQRTPPTGLGQGLETGGSTLSRQNTPESFGGADNFGFGALSPVTPFDHQSLYPAVPTAPQRPTAGYSFEQEEKQRLSTPSYQRDTPSPFTSQPRRDF